MNKPRGRKALILVELNEINFDIVQRYVSSNPGRFPGFEKAMAGRSVCTTSENEYENLEPWIQWASVHTGLSYDEHKVFRLGDMVGKPIPQIFEQLEQLGIRVGCISPMNAENRLHEPAYFIPDPWTNTPSDGSWWSKRISAAVSQAVNDNAQSKVGFRNLVYIALALLRFAKPRHYLKYVSLAGRSRGAPWRKALVLDLLLNDLHSSLFSALKPRFSTLFLNAGAHIQHHYYLNSPHLNLKADTKNPEWYISSNLDPVMEMLVIYDGIVAEYLSRTDVDVVVATGLSQCPYTKAHYYYRLKDHDRFLKRIGIEFREVFPRMTRDFLITFENAAAAISAKTMLSKLYVASTGEPLFGEIENRGSELFVVLTYPNEITPLDVAAGSGDEFNLSQFVVFVAIKNGMHQGKGYAFFTPVVAQFAPPDGGHVRNLYWTIMNYFKADISAEI